MHFGIVVVINLLWYGYGKLCCSSKVVYKFPVTIIGEPEVGRIFWGYMVLQLYGMTRRPVLLFFFEAALHTYVSSNADRFFLCSRENGKDCKSKKYVSLTKQRCIFLQ